MKSEKQQRARITQLHKGNNAFLQKFRLYETRSKFYMIGRDKHRSIWRVLKIDRLDTSELNITEDSTTYTEIECCDLLRRIDDGNKSTGGIKFVTTCYGIVGFIKFLGPYYMLLVTKRRQIGVICGHAVYAISKSEMIPIPNSTLRSNAAYSKNENRYKKLLCSVDLTKDFFFSYSYNVMHSLQKNLFSHETGQPFSETMFVWNKYLTSGIHNQLGNNMWTVALVYGFFTQVKLSIAGRDFNLTLIARRSRHYAGTRYLKRGVNEKGCVANDVETEQIVFEDVPDGFPLQITSVVQNRGSIPLFWSQEISRLNIRPEIILSRKDQKFEATRLHFENLMKRYGDPIIILNLIKTHEKRPRESLLRLEFVNAIDLINKGLPKESCLKFLHLDLNKFSGDKTVNVLELLGEVARDMLNLTGIFYCQVNPISKSPELLDFPCFEKNDGSDCNKMEEADKLEALGTNNVINIKLLHYQKGVLRTNCIDCLDRTNVAQYSYGWAALGHQLHALGYIDSPSLDLDSPLTNELMKVYEKMGDTLALQYGGSAAHNKIFCQRRGQWKAATLSQEFLRTLQRYYSNVYMDAEKQDAINVFLGHYQPQLGEPALWELDSDQHFDVGRRNSNFFADSSRRTGALLSLVVKRLKSSLKSSFKRSLSDGNILCDSGSTDIINIQKNEDSARLFRDNVQNDKKSDSSPEIPTCESDSSYSRYTNSISHGQLLPDVLPEHSLVNDNILFNKHWDTSNCSNVLDVDWLSSSGNLCEEENFERSTLINSPVAGLSSDNMVTASDNDLHSNLRGKEQSGVDLGYGPSTDSDVPAGFSDEFVHWVTHGDMLFL